MSVLGHMLKHVPRHVLRHVLEHVPKHVPDTHLLARHVLGLTKNVSFF